MNNNKIKLNLEIAKQDLIENSRIIEASAKSLSDIENVGDYGTKTLNENINIACNKINYLKGKIDAYKEILKEEIND